MKLLKNPFIGEGLETCFSHIPVLRSYVYYVLCIALATFFWWPRGPLADVLRTGQPPQTFTVTAITVFVCLLFLNARYGSEDYARPDSTKVHDIVTLTPVRVSTIVVGKLVTAVLHILFLLALAMPILIATRAVSGRSFGALGVSLLVVGSSVLAFRMLGFLFFVVFDTRSTLRSVILLTSVLVLVLGPLAFFPAATPISALMSADSQTAALFGSPIPYYLISVIINLLAVAAFSVASISWLRFVRRQHLKRAAAVAQQVATPAPSPSSGENEAGNEGSGGIGSGGSQS
jgi:hypothetical protein